MNVLTIVGRATKDPITRTSQYGEACYLCVAVSAGKNKADFFNVILTEGAAERCSKYVRKGDLVTVQGSVHLSQWGNNNEHSSLSVKGKSIEFFGQRSAANSDAPTVSTQNANKDGFEEVDDYDMPF